MKSIAFKQDYLSTAWLSLSACVLMLIFTAAASAQREKAPPLIDRELFFGNPEISGAEISPDGKYIAFLKPYKGTRNIWIKTVEEPFEKARHVTNDARRPIPNFAWSADGKYILFVQDKGGDENLNVYAVSPDEKPAAGAEVPAARNLTKAKNIRAEVYLVSKKEPDMIYVALNERDPAWHDLYKIKISTGERNPVLQNTERLTEWYFDNADNLRLALRTAPSGETEIMRVGANSLIKIYSCKLSETCIPVRFHKDNKRVYLRTNKGENTDLTRLVLLDTETGKEETVESDSQNRVDLGGVFFSDATGEILFTSYNNARPRRIFKDKSFEAEYKWLQRRLPGTEIEFNNSTRDERIWLITAESDTEPGATYLYDRRRKKLALQYRIYERLPREHLARQTAIRYKSSDGLEIPAYLTLPKGVEAKNLPVVVFPHGGPWARDVWGYEQFSQFLANRGYAVLQPNFRGSTGYGKKFLNAGNKEWGQKMQDDLTWGVKYLVEQGIADPKRVGIMGGSYGGYATLAGVAFTPDLYAAGVAIVAPSNLITLVESFPAYWEARRQRFYERMGNPNTPEGRAQLERQSPLNSADKIKTPLMVVQGANDPRVNKREADQIVAALRDRNFPVEYIVAPDEGHGFARPVNNMAMLAAAEKFLAKHLGGRFQESMPPEVEARLREITVDPKTVKIVQKSGDSSIPKP